MKKFLKEDIDIPYLEYYSESNKESVIIFHGLAEYIDRYEKIAKYLFENGINVFVFEYLGHGELKIDKYIELKNEDYERQIRYIYNFLEYIIQKIGYVPIILGHSFGSLIALKVAEEYKIRKLILTGLPLQNNFLLVLGTIISKIEKRLGLKKSILNLIFNFFNLPFMKEGKNSWLTRDKKVVEEYNSNDYCNSKLTVDFFYNMFKLMKDVKTNIEKIDNNINLLLMVGEKDTSINRNQINKYLKRIRNSSRNIEYLIIKEARHELINELNKEIAYKKILEFIKEQN